MLWKGTITETDLNLISDNIGNQIEKNRLKFDGKLKIKGTNTEIKGM